MTTAGPEARATKRRWGKNNAVTVMTAMNQECRSLLTREEHKERISAKRASNGS